MATAAMEPRLQTLVDKQAIRDVLMRYARGIDRMDWELVRSCYHPGAVDEHGNFVAPVEEFVPWVSGALATMHGTTHFICNTLIDVEGDVAWSEAYCIAYQRTPSRSGTDNDHILGVRYNDRFERRSGEWRIAHRKVVWEWSRIDPVGRTWNFTPEFIRGHRDKSDPVYDRPGFRAGEARSAAQRLQELLDKQEIYEALCRYARGVDRIDTELVRSAYHADAYDDHGAYRGSADGFATWVRESVATLLGANHYLGNVLVDVQGDLAYSEAYTVSHFQMPSRQSGETDQFVGARFIDRFERRAGGPWKIAQRRVAHDWSRIDPMGRRWTFGERFLRGKPDQSDPVYDRPGFSAGGPQSKTQHLQNLLDKEEIYEVLCRYARGVDRLDMELVRACYHDDASDDHGTYRGPVEGFVQHAREGLATMLGTEHYISNALIDVQGDVAYSEAYCLAYHRMPSRQSGETDQFVGCRYIDRFERRQGGPWKIADRRVAYDWSRIDPLGRRWNFTPEFIRGQRSQEDLVYQRS